jgi:transposase InsO family protein
MDLHANAALSLNRRRRLARRIVEERWTLAAAAAAAEVSVQTARKWVARFRAEGEAGLFDRSSAPHSCPHATPEDRVQAIAALRKVRLTGEEIAAALSMPETTVSGILKRIGMGRLGRLGLEPERRYERSRPGELVHVDVKKLGRIQVPGHRVTGNRGVHARRTRKGNAGRLLGTAGWEFVHICVDDATRLAYAEVLSDEKAVTAIAFFRRALRFFASYGIEVERVMSDNGSCYRAKLHALCCRTLGIRHLFTRPYRPQTNGKAERFIRTLLERWAYGAIYASSKERTAALDGWLFTYNHRRRHRALGRKPPAARLTELNRNNLLGSYS